MVKLWEDVNGTDHPISSELMDILIRLFPWWKLCFNQIESESFPKLRDQLIFFIELVEDIYEKVYWKIPHHAVLAAIVGIIYVKRQIDLSGFKNEISMAKSGLIIENILLTHEQAYRSYAEWRKISWDKLLSSNRFRFIDTMRIR